jgi:hypothetical protein
VVDQDSSRAGQKRTRKAALAAQWLTSVETIEAIRKEIGIDMAPTYRDLDTMSVTGQFRRLMTGARAPRDSKTMEDLTRRLARVLNK